MALKLLSDIYKEKVEFVLNTDQGIIILELTDGSKLFYLAQSDFSPIEIPNNVKSFKALGNKDLLCKIIEDLGIYQKKDRLLETHSDTKILFDFQNNKLSYKAISSNSPSEVEVKCEFAKTLDRKKSSVLIIDDSAVIRKLLTKIINGTEKLEVCYAASGPEDAKNYLASNKPDIITLDIHMPEIDGVTLFKELIKEMNIPTVIISSMSIQEGPLVMEALSHGVLAYIEKPDASNISLVEGEIIQKLEVLSTRKVLTNLKAKEVQTDILIGDEFQNTNGIVAIGSSTGGTQALEKILTKLPSIIPPIVIVQHIPEVFSKAFADRLNNECRFTVKEVENGEKILPNTVYIAKGGKQFKVNKLNNELIAVLSDEKSESYQFKPSVDFLFESLRDITSINMVAVILTGMGRDGSESMLELHKKGIHTIGQNEESCVVYGMPKAANEIGACSEMVHLDKISQAIIKAFNK